jgi:hypothetical protein
MRPRLLEAAQAVIRSPTFRDVVLPYAVERTALMLAVCFANQFISPGVSWHALPRAALFDPWLKWDSEHYLFVASVGYGRSVWGTPNAFFPLYPWLIRGLAHVVSYAAAALVVAHVASLVAFVLLYEVVRRVDGVERARRAVWIALVFPTSFFLIAGYAESLYLALTLGATLAWLSRKQWVAFACVVAACLTRPPGVFAMSVPFVADWLLRGRKRDDVPWFVVGSVLGALALFAVYRVSTGDPLAFAHSPTVLSMSGVGGIAAAHGHSPAPFWAVLLDEGMGPNLVRRELNWLALGLTAWAFAVLLRKREIAFAGITLLSVLVPLIAHGTVMDAASMARYAMVAFPIYLALARALPSGPGAQALDAAFLVMQAVLASLFGAGVWVE